MHFYLSSGRFVFQKPKKHFVDIFAIDEFMLPHDAFLLETKIFIEPHDLFVTVGRLAPNPVQVEETEGIVGQQLGCPCAD